VGDGVGPYGGLVADSKGNLYGTTVQGGPNQCQCGIAYELVRSGNSYTERVLWNFTGGADGGGPFGPMILDGAGNLYGTAISGGSSGAAGVVFEISP